jgi:hypothetical protein
VITNRRARPGFTTHALVGVLLALVGLVAPLTVLTVDATSKGVTWSIDHTEKTITAEVKITLTPKCPPDLKYIKEGGSPAPCEVPKGAVADIKKAIEDIWNKDNKYYCYDIVVKVDITIDNSTQPNDPADRLRVQVDHSPVPVRSHVRGSQSATAAANGMGSTPNDQLDAGNYGTKSSIWAYPPRNGQTYAHETGHVLGLDDGYEDVKDANGNTVGSQIRAGHADDLMSNNWVRRTLDKSTLRRMVERQGYKKTDLRCNYKIDQPSQGGRIKGTKCDPLGGFWRATGTYAVGPASGAQEWAVSIDATTRKGVFSYTDHQVAEFIKAIVVTTDGNAFGDASITIDDELFVHMHLKEQWHTYHAVTKGGQGNDQNALPIAIDLIWDPIGKCPP